MDNIATKFEIERNIQKILVQTLKLIQAVAKSRSSIILGTPIPHSQSTYYTRITKIVRKITIGTIFVIAFLSRTQRDPIPISTYILSTYNIISDTIISTMTSASLHNSRTNL